VATILDLDMNETPEDERYSHVEWAAETATELLHGRYPEDAGHQYVRASYKPFEEWPDMLAHFTSVRLGWRWGFKVIVQPADFQCRQIHIDLEQDTRLGELPMLVGSVGGFAAAIIAVICVIVIGGTWRPGPLFLAFAFGGMGVGLALFGIVKALTMSMAATDSAALASEEQELAEAVVAALSGDGADGDADEEDTDDDEEE